VWQSEKAFWAWAAIDGSSWLLLTGLANSDLALAPYSPLTNWEVKDFCETIGLLIVEMDPK
jgi:hypothetical protein